MRRSLLALVAVVALASVATAQPRRTGAASRLGADGKGLQQQIDDLAREGLPAELVELKIQEGLAKGVDPVRVAVTARGMVNRVRLVSLVVRKHTHRGNHTRVAVRAGVAAHAAGLTYPDIDRIASAAAVRAPASIAVGLHAAADLRGRGYPRERTVDLVVALLGRDTHGDELPRALAAVDAVRRNLALSPAEAVDRVATAVEAGAGLREAVAALEQRARGAPN